ncbi:MAG TPA: hypothetical protein VGI32_03175 [Steroidobacteraceae bacterium]|jgi:chromosome segregation ATPase
MSYRYMERDAAAEMLERRWFATFKAASAARAECEALLEALALTEATWAQARERLAKVEALRDALAEELAELDDPGLNAPRYRLNREECSAA